MASIEPSKRYTAKDMTPWISGAVDPVRPGVYHVNASWYAYRYFDGTQWYAGATTDPRSAYSAYVNGGKQRANRPLQWRGLKKDPL
jgi:hypothetical protein